MNKIFFFLFLLPVFFVNAKEFQDAKIIFDDGSSRVGLVDTELGYKSINFKADKNSKVDKIDLAGIRSIVFLSEDKKTTLAEFDRVRVFGGMKGDRISDLTWGQVLERGPATLYLLISTMQGSVYNSLSTAQFKEYYCIRDGKAAAKQISAVATANNNATFKMRAPLYFADYPELAAKIKSKEYTYKDIVLVVQEYNKWVADKNKSSKK